MSERERGTVKFFAADKGYGFLVRSNGGVDAFVHYTSIQGEGFKTLEQGQEVEFEVEDGIKGPAASNVTIII